jgi:ribose-phosphate pyrophosphokinase
VTALPERAAVVLGPDDHFRAAAVPAGVPVLRARRDRFPDGEELVTVPGAGALAGRSVLVVATTSPPQPDRLLGLLQLADAVAGAAAVAVDCFVPYLAYQRQDRRMRVGEPVSAGVAMAALAALGVRSLLTVDKHSPQPAPPPGLRTVDLATTAAFAAVLARSGYRPQVVVAPDAGGVARAAPMAATLGLPVVELAKAKSAARGTFYDELPDGLAGRRCLVVEDLCSSGSTLRPLCDLLAPVVAGLAVVVTHLLAPYGQIAGRLPRARPLLYSDSCGDPEAPVPVLPAALAAWAQPAAQPLGAGR